MVELDEPLGDEHRVVPRQDDDARPELDVGRPGGDVRERLERVGHQPVAREVVLGEPHGVQPERLRQHAQLELAAEEELIRLVVDLLESGAVADVQRPCVLLRRSSRLLFRAVLPAWARRRTEADLNRVPLPRLP